MDNGVHCEMFITDFCMESIEQDLYHNDIHKVIITVMRFTTS